jgi:ABC-type multidrug transport system ATPase subunit
LTDAGKRFNRDWIFRHFNYKFEQGTAYAITGPNGSGKSTLLQVIGAAMQLSTGNILFEEKNGPVDIEKIYQHVSFCAPYLEVVEEMTLGEFLSFHYQFKKIMPGITVPVIINMLGLEATAAKQIRYFSSGMRQRVKLAQAIFSDTTILLLDEPCTNLDAVGIKLYHELIEKFCKEKLVIVSSNDEVEYVFCREKININQYK